MNSVSFCLPVPRAATSSSEGRKQTDVALPANQPALPVAPQTGSCQDVALTVRLAGLAGLTATVQTRICCSLGMKLCFVRTRPLPSCQDE